jgi:hypothetical protein
MVLHSSITLKRAMQIRIKRLIQKKSSENLIKKRANTSRNVPHPTGNHGIKDVNYLALKSLKTTYILANQGNQTSYGAYINTAY